MSEPSDGNSWESRTPIISRVFLRDDSDIQLQVGLSQYKQSEHDSPEFRKTSFVIVQQRTDCAPHHEEIGSS
jgi:hypothetical protein